MFNALGPRDVEEGALLPVVHLLRGEGFDVSEDGTGRGTPLVPVHAFDARQSDVLQYGDKTGSLDTDGHSIAVSNGMHVRRLTPVECERLQGFPDGYTAISWRAKPADQCPDGPRYKALGNSWAVPVVRWIGERIHRELRGELRPET